MKKNDRLINCILAITGSILLWGILAVFFDLYYDLNDDVLIKDILAGFYTGTPDAHNNQMLYPISIIISCLYRITDKIPWFGLLEVAAMMISFGLIGYRICGLIHRFWFKVFYMVLQMFICAGLMMWEIVNVQYTVVAGMLTAAAAVWLYTGEPVGTSDQTVVGLHRDRWGRIFRIRQDADRNIDRDNTIPKVYKKATYAEMGAFIRRNVPAIVLTVIAFNIRSELVLLLSPLLAAAAIAKWVEEDHKWDHLAICGYLGVFLSICILLLASLSLDGIAYSSPEWKEYRRFFDARTEVYDFTGVPDYEENKAFYEKAGISEEQVSLLTDYNYYLDESIDADLLETVAEGVKSGAAVGRRTYRKTIREAVWEYVHNSLDIMSTETTVSAGSGEHIFADEAGQHRGFVQTVIILYIALIIIAFLTGDTTVAVKIPVFVILRSIPWIYVYLQGRVLGRITHPLYILEIMVLLAMLFAEGMRTEGEDSGIRRMTGGFILLAGCIIAIICILMLPVRYRYLNKSAAEREAANAEYSVITDKVTSAPDTYFYIDTYSTVDATEKIFGTEPVSKKNMQLLGGWMGNSPLDKDKQDAYEKSEVILTNID